MLSVILSRQQKNNAFFDVSEVLCASYDEVRFNKLFK